MRKRIALAAIMLLIFLSYCDKDGNNEIKETVIEEKAVCLNLINGKMRTVKLFGIRFPFLYNDGNYAYVYGYSTVKGKQGVILRKYDVDLKLLEEKTFPLGEGPGDVGGGAHFYPGSDYIYVPDNTQARINIFDKNFGFVKFVNLPGYLPITMIKDCRYFLGAHFEMGRTKKENKHTFELVSFPGLKKKKIYTLGPVRTFNDQNKHIIGEFPEYSYFHRNYKNMDRIYFVNMKSYRIIVFDMEGTMIDNVRVAVKPMPVPPDLKIKWLKEQTMRRGLDRRVFSDWIQPAAKVVPLEKGFVVIRRNDYEDECTGMVEGDYFNFDVEMLGKVQFPCFFRVNKLTRGYIVRSVTSFGGHVYVANEVGEEYYFEKWRLSE